MHSYIAQFSMLLKTLCKLYHIACILSQFFFLSVLHCKSFLWVFIAVGLFVFTDYQHSTVHHNCFSHSAVEGRLRCSEHSCPRCLEHLWVSLGHSTAKSETTGPQLCASSPSPGKARLLPIALVQFKFSTTKYK